MAGSGHEQVRRLAGITASEIAQVEVPAALWRKHRTGELSAQDARLLTSAFAGDVSGLADDPPRVALVAVTPEILQVAARLVTRHPLHAYDAVQLASALAVRDAVPGTCFVAFDAVLNEAAAAEGLQAISDRAAHE